MDDAREEGVEALERLQREQFLRWQQMTADAKANMARHRGRPGLLIEVAAQHPLDGGLTPGPEFRARLEAAVTAYRLEVEQGHAVKIYVPGSRHEFEGVADEVSLSTAGVTYLKSLGIPESDLFGDDANEKYKGEEGVYSSADECYVSCSLFEELDFGRLAVFCGPAQLMRKVLGYIRLGCFPEMCSVPVERPYHDFVDEAFLHIPVMLGDGTNLHISAEEAIRLRKLRTPGLK